MTRRILFAALLPWRWLKAKQPKRFHLTIEPIGAVETTRFDDIYEGVRLDSEVRINGELARISIFTDGIAEDEICFSGPLGAMGVSELLSWMEEQSVSGPATTGG